MAIDLVAVRAIETNCRIVWALCLRDLKRRNRASPIGLFSSILEPIVTVLIMALVFEAVRLRVPSLGDYFVLFLMTGVLPIYAYRKGLVSVQRILKGEKNLLWAGHVRPIHMTLAGLLEITIITTAVFFIFILFFKARYEVEEPRSLALSIVPLFCNAVIGFGFGVFNAAVGIWFPYWNTMFRMISGPIGILSGIFYLPTRLPNYILDVLYYNPLLHSIEYCRQWFFFNYESTIFDPWYYFGWVFGALAAGLAVERIFNRSLVGTKI